MTLRTILSFTGKTATARWLVWFLLLAFVQVHRRFGFKPNAGLEGGMRIPYKEVHLVSFLTLTGYNAHVQERAALGIPPLPLNADQTQSAIGLLGTSDNAIALELIRDRVSPGVQEASRVKAEFLLNVAQGSIVVDGLPPSVAIAWLGTMLGGYNVVSLVQLLSANFAEEAATQLKQIVYVSDGQLNDLKSLADQGNQHASDVLQSWASAQWLHDKPAFPDTLHVVAFVVPGETNTDDFSPASEGMTRQDIPLHALSMLANKMPDALPEITQLKQLGFQVAYVGDTVGTGSSRKSAINSLAYHTGNDIPGVPNKRVAPVVIGGKIAPIFKNATATAGGVAIECDISEIQNGDILLINFDDGNISKDGQVIASFTVDDTSKDVYRVGGTIPYKAGSGLTNRVRRVLGMETMQFGAPIQDDPNTQYTLAQKMVGAACGLRGVLPGTECEPVMTTVGSQDTTGPMTRAEMEELACLGFTADAVLQSFCHTAAHPKPEDLITQATLAPFISERGGISLKPGDGIIHSWLNRLVLPDTVGTGGDSHTRFPLGISFPADSGMVAYAATMGTMPIKMPESVLVKFVGELQPGITLRDVVNAIPYAAMQQGKVVYDEAKGTTTKNVFNGRIMEMEGLPDIKIEQAFELMDATAERSCAAGCIQLGIATVTEWLNSCVALLEAMIDAGYEDARTLQRRVDRMREWLANPALMTADAGATYADVVIVDLSAITEPIVAAPNNPDNIKLLSEVAGQPLDHVFVGSCQTNVGHYRATANVLEGEKVAVPTLVVPPTKQDAIILQVEGYWATLGAANCYTEGEWDFPVPGCSLCMGNQRRVDNATIFSTSTRNFNNRMGKGSNVYLGSAELAAVCGLLGRIPTVEEYLEVVARKVNPFASELYRFANFDQMQNVRELLAA